MKNNIPTTHSLPIWVEIFNEAKKKIETHLKQIVMPFFSKKQSSQVVAVAPEDNKDDDEDEDDRDDKNTSSTPLADPLPVVATGDRLAPPNPAVTRKWLDKFKNARPGDKGFNKVVYRIMVQRGLYLGGHLQSSCAPGKGFAQQETAAWLAGPETPIDRLLVIHRTGSGKTDVMVRIVDEYYFDQRAKIVIVPNNALVNNFYEKFYHANTRFNAFAEYVAVRDHRPNTYARFQDVVTMEGTLSHRGKPGELAAPIRPIRYNVAGGMTVAGAGGPELPIFKIGYERGGNPYDNKIVIMDEVHNLVRPKADTDPRALKKLARLRELLFSAKNTVLVGLTATPLVKDVSDGNELIRIIKGAEFASKPTNEGFISYFNSLPVSIYPTSLPALNAVELKRIPLQGANLKKYNAKVKEIGTLSKDPEKMNEQLERLQNYCNTTAYYANVHEDPYKSQVRKHPDDYATKLSYIADQVIAYPHKCAILIHRRMGFKALKNIIIDKDPNHGKSFAFMGKPNNLHEMNSNPILAQFNDIKLNGEGQLIKCIIVDAESYGEGIDLIGVRRLLIAHPPPNYAAFKQWVGRVFRACGYSYLPNDERNVMVEMYCAKLPDGTKTADEEILEILLAETKVMEKALHELFAAPASDKKALGM